MTWIRAASPKSHAAHPGGLDRLVGVHFGAGVLPDALVRIGPLVAIAAVLVAVLALLPGFRARVGDEGRVVASQAARCAHSRDSAIATRPAPR